MLLQRSSHKRSQICLPDSQTRLDIARRLHDGLAQDLAVLGYRLDEVIGDPNLEQSLRDALRRIRIDFAAMAVEFRDELYRIRLMDRNDLQRELDSLLIHIDHDLDLGYPLMTDTDENALAHCILELARNCVKHSQASRFTISWRQIQNELQIDISDNGVGGISMKERSFGLRGIEEWLRAIGATFKNVDDDRGTSFRITLIPTLKSSEHE